MKYIKMKKIMKVRGFFFPDRIMRCVESQIFVIIRWECVIATSPTSSLTCFEGWQFYFTDIDIVQCFTGFVQSITATEIQLHALPERLQLGSRAQSMRLNWSSSLLCWGQGWIYLSGKPCHVTKWPLEENGVVAVLQKVRNTKTW